MILLPYLAMAYFSMQMFWYWRTYRVYPMGWFLIFMIGVAQMSEADAVGAVSLVEDRFWASAVALVMLVYSAVLREDSILGYIVRVAAAMRDPRTVLAPCLWLVCQLIRLGIFVCFAWLLGGVLPIGTQMVLFVGILCVIYNDLHPSNVTEAVDSI